MKEKSFLEISVELGVSFVLAILFTVAPNIHKRHKFNSIEKPEDREALHVLDGVVRFVSYLAHLMDCSHVSAF